jgi:L-ascorbate metabolism protein UlaG (beta-lactamase superfamily)
MFRPLKRAPNSVQRVVFGMCRFEEFIQVVRLSWAGVQIGTDEFTIVIDHLENIPRGAGVGGHPLTKAFVCSRAIDAALITHLRDDHYDRDSLRKRLKPDGIVICHEACARTISSDRFRVVGLRPYQSTNIGPFAVTAIPAVDGLGDDQTSFLVELDDVKILHCGDTIWHGHWWRIAEQFGPINLAFLPINGALIEIAGAVPTGVPVVLTPAQAAAAADLLCAKLAVPIHYGMFDHPPGFSEWPNAVEVFLRDAAGRNVPARIVEPGEELLLDRTPPTAD